MSNRYLTTRIDEASNHSIDARQLTWWDLANRGVKSCLTWSGTNTFVADDGNVNKDGIVGWFSNTEPDVHDLVMFDMELHPWFSAATGMAIVDAIRSVRAGARVVFYQQDFGAVQGMSMEDHVHPNPTQSNAITAEMRRCAPYIRHAGAAIITAQYRRPDNVDLYSDFIKTQSSRLNMYAPGAEKIVIVNSTIDWKEANYPISDGACLQSIVNAVNSTGCSMMAFEPYELKPETLSPLWKDGWFFTRRAQ